MKNRIIFFLSCLAACCLIAAGGFFLFNKVIEAKYESGYKACLADVADRASSQAGKDVAEIDRIRVDTERLDDSNLYTHLARLGIMRADSDR